MSILLLVVVLLVIAIVLSRLTWASQFGERRSIKHHEQAMDVLRSVAGRPEDAEARAYSAQGAAHSDSHVRSSVEDAASFPAPASGAGGGAVPEAAVHREETIRILRTEPPGAEPPTAEPPGFEPPGAEPPGSDAPAAEPSESRPEEQPAHALEGQPNGDGEPARPALAFSDDDTGRSGPVTLPPGVADAIRGARGRRANGGGWGDDRQIAGGDGWGNGHRWEDDPAAASTLPKPPSIDWASSRSEARSRSRARTRSNLWGRARAPFVATGRAASGARHRLGTRRGGAGVDTVDAGDSGSGPWSTAPAAPTTAAEGVKVMTDDTAEVALPTERRDVDVTTAGDDEAVGATTAPVAEVPTAAAFDDHALVPEPNGATALDAAQSAPSWGAKVSQRPRWALGSAIAAIVIVAGVVAGILAASTSTSSKKAPQASQASHPASTAPAPPPSPLTLVSHDDQGAVYNVNANRLSVSAVASGRVWLEVVASTGPFGQVLWQGVLTSGQTQTITNDAPVWIRIGASSNVAVTVNGSGVILPQAPNTYNLTFTHS